MAEKFATMQAGSILAPRSEEQTWKRTKVVCTLGPSCADVETIGKMVDLGMNIARMNFSHGDHEYHGNLAKAVREVNKTKPDKMCGLLLDTKGPEIRTGMLEGHQAIELEAGQELEICTDYTFEGNSSKIACSYEKLCTSVHVGAQILVADGSLICEVTEILENSVKTKCLNGCKLGERKNMNLPGIKVELPVLSEKDEDDLCDFGLKYNVDFVAASFVQSAEDVENIRDVLGPRGANIKIISKIENQEGLNNFDEILAESDGIMVARGDLGMEIPPEKVFIAQKIMIAKCNAVGKPVITATQMLESMCNNPRPTRAEAGDVANAVLDGTDAVMLSGETAGGKHPLAAVEVMSNICIEAEGCLDYQSIYQRTRRVAPKPLSSTEAVCSAAVRTALDMAIKLIVVITDTGRTASLVSKYRPASNILVVSMNQSTILQVNANYGCISLKVPSYEGTENVIRFAVGVAKNNYNLIGADDQVICIHGANEEDVNQANIMKILTVSELGI